MWITLAFYFINLFVRGIGFLFIYSWLQASSIMIWVVTLLRSKVYCSTTTEATSARYASTRSPEQSSTAAGDLQGPALQSSYCRPSRMSPRREEQHCSRDLPRWMEAGGWMYRFRCRGRAVEAGSQVGGENGGNNGETVQREAKPTRDTGSRPLPNRPQ